MPTHSFCDLKDQKLDFTNHVENSLFPRCLMSKQQGSAEQRWICLDSCIHCHTEIECVHPICYLTYSRQTLGQLNLVMTGTDSIPLDVWQGSHHSTTLVTDITWPGQQGTISGSGALEADTSPLSQQSAHMGEWALGRKRVNRKTQVNGQWEEKEWTERHRWMGNGKKKNEQKDTGEWAMGRKRMNRKT